MSPFVSFLLPSHSVDAFDYRILKGKSFSHRTKTFTWPLAHLPLCFVHAGGLLKRDVFFSYPGLCLPACLLELPHPVLHLHSSALSSDVTGSERPFLLLMEGLVPLILIPF